jgi:hypothetical protein
MSAPITNAHLRLANQIVASPPSPLVIATLIADSEARACEQLRAEVTDANARAERAEAELAAERARLDWLVKSSDNPLAINLLPSYGWTEVKKNLRASIDAAMKEGAK